MARRAAAQKDPFGWFVERWPTVVEEIRAKSVPVSTLLAEATPTSMKESEDNTVVLELTMPPGTGFHVKALREQDDLVQQALQVVYGRTYPIVYVQPDAPATPRQLNQQERHLRRKEIKARWNVRVARRLLQTETAGPASSLLEELLHLSQWAPLTDLTLELDHQTARELVAHTARIIQLKEMPYDEYLQTDEWRRKADACKQRYGNTCALDNTHTADHAHHRTYQRRGREHPNDLIPLCAACHTHHHK